MRELIYLPQCSKPKILCTGQIGEQVSETFSKHHYDVKNRPDNRELVKDFHENHDFSDTLNGTILQNNIKTAAARRQIDF